MPRDGPIDEVIPTDKSLLAWREGQPSQSSTLSQFLDAHPPSTTRRQAGGDGWIWVISRRSAAYTEHPPSAESLTEAKDTLHALTERFEEIETSTVIPTRKSAKSGPSKKMARETAVQACENRLREIGGKDWPCGKWFFYESTEYVDLVFRTLANSIIDGPLSKLPNAICHTVKVLTADSIRDDAGSSSNKGRGPQQLICLYFADVWNRQHATESLESLVKEHGQIPNSAKADLYSMIGLDSKHPSRLRTTLYRPGELFNWEVMREWQSAYIAAKKESKAQSASKAHSTARTIDDRSKTGVSKLGVEGRTPVTAEEYWPSPAKDGEKEVTVKPGESNSLPADDDESQTESESEAEASRPAKMAKLSTPPPSDKVDEANANHSSPAKSPPSTRPYRPLGNMPSTPETKAKPPAAPTPPPKPTMPASRSSPAPLKVTPKPVLKTNRKRDRFGRDDF